jgi:hypothetical protein
MPISSVNSRGEVGLVVPAVAGRVVGQRSVVPGIEVADRIVDPVARERPLRGDADVPLEEGSAAGAFRSCASSTWPTCTSERSSSMTAMTSSRVDVTLQDPAGTQVAGDASFLSTTVRSWEGGGTADDERNPE